MQQKVTHATRLENFETFIRETSSKHDRIDEEIESLHKSNTDIDSGLAEKQLVADKVQNEIAHTDGSFQEVAEQLSKASTQFNEKNIAFIRQQNKVQSFQREASFRERQQQEAIANLQRDRKLLDQYGAEKIEIEEKVKSLEKQLIEGYARKKEQEARLTEAEQQYFKARGGINEIEDELRKVNKSRQDVQILVNQLKDKFSDVRLQLSSLSERLRIEFGVDINAILKNEPDPSWNQEELQLKVDRFKNRLDNYGEINPMAVEAYDAMKERYESITVQRDDILAAKESLIETIKEIEETATAQFQEAFESVRLHFIDVFRNLFTKDDNCDLILLDPENPLESKIEIVAKPKGKRPQTISQLSGGEKTLTATALLFALYLLKPAPFCIFDEVDAPLDDANIEKFNKIIKKFSENSQFIIVTHNKLTMAAVDTIYGVYMHEQGVSSVNQVDFRDFEHRTVLEAVRG